MVKGTAMKPKLSLCGFRCDLCLAYKPNIETHPENRQLLSNGWHTYFGFRLPAEEIFCEGCSAESPTTLDRDCPVRPCVIVHDLPNCAYCEDYICEILTQRLVNFDDIQVECDAPIPEADRQCFILPYENEDRLRNLRQKTTRSDNCGG
jgi:hypothetical protein